MSGSSSSPGHSQLMAEPLNRGGIQAPVLRVEGHVLASILQLTHAWGVGGAQGGAQDRGGHGAATERPRGGHGAATERPRGGHGAA